MAKKVLINEDNEEVNNNGLLVLFLIVLTIFVGSLCFIGGIVYTSYLDGKNEDKCIDEIDNKVIIDEKKVDNYVITDSKVISDLNDKVKELNIIDKDNKMEYVYNYLEDSKYYYVLIAYGSFEVKDSKRIIYTGIDGNNIYKEIDKNDKFILDDSNYNVFSKYKIVFIKDGNNSSFSSIERIE